MDYDAWLFKHGEDRFVDPDCEDGECGQCSRCAQEEWESYESARADHEYENYKERMWEERSHYGRAC
jgi:hypothetical protein